MEKGLLTIVAGLMVSACALPFDAGDESTGTSAKAVGEGQRGQPDLIIDNHYDDIPDRVSFTENWPKASDASEHFGNLARFAEVGGEVDTYRFTPNFSGPGDYRVMV